MCLLTARLIILLSNESDDEKVLSNGPGSYRVAHCDTNGSHAKPADVFIDIQSNFGSSNSDGSNTMDVSN